MGKKQSKSSGRKSKTTETSRRRATALRQEHGASRQQWLELLSMLSEYFAQGMTSSEIRGQISKRPKHPFPYDELLRGENLWDLLREAAELGMLIHAPLIDQALQNALTSKYRWLLNHVDIVDTASTDALARQGAQKLLKMIHERCRLARCKEVHVGFAGGRTLHLVAKELARLLRASQQDNPDTLVFHGIVAGMDDEDFFADPNSFINYFAHMDNNPKVRFVRLPLPSIIHTDEEKQLHCIESIERVYKRKEELHIIVSSGGLMSDPHSTLRSFYPKAVIKRLQEKQGSSDLPTEDEIIRPLNDLGVVGDLLWQPVSAEGPVSSTLEYRVSTLINLDQLSEFIQKKNGSVLLVLGCSGLSRMPKSILLDTALSITPRLITDLVVDSPTVSGMESLSH